MAMIAVTFVSGDSFWYRISKYCCAYEKQKDIERVEKPPPIVLVWMVRFGRRHCYRHCGLAYFPEPFDNQYFIGWQCRRYSGRRVFSRIAALSFMEKVWGRFPQWVCYPEDAA